MSVISEIIYTDRILFHIKHQITRELSRDIVCVFEIINLCNTIYHYITADKNVIEQKLLFIM